MAQQQSNTYIKARRRGEKRFRFVGAGGALTHLRVHASRWAAEDAEATALKLAADNPEYEFRAQAAEEQP